MKSADLAIRIGVMNKLNGIISYPIRDMAARPGDEPPFILLSTQTGTDDALKTQFGSQNTLLIQIYGKKNLLVNRGEIDAIADDIMQAIIPQNTADYIQVTGFEIVRTSLDSLNDDTITNSDGITCVKRIRIRFLLREL